MSGFIIMTSFAALICLMTTEIHNSENKQFLF